VIEEFIHFGALRCFVQNDKAGEEEDIDGMVMTKDVASKVDIKVRVDDIIKIKQLHLSLSLNKSRRSIQAKSQ